MCLFPPYPRDLVKCRWFVTAMFSGWQEMKSLTIQWSELFTVDYARTRSMVVLGKELTMVNGRIDTLLALLSQVNFRTAAGRCCAKCNLTLQLIIQRISWHQPPPPHIFPPPSPFRNNPSSSVSPSLCLMYSTYFSAPCSQFQLLTR